ncbi:OLC1v1035093C1 [Oldenlandia corymbosa var. corymbosa]|uniref:OLC1v1035093C1 n=1 Tax=Oldenlandia corymbosa var. corymbosa TaxID=529605 RepID=A0AAV1CVE4_OLDCO|nr:OLC1v1035093C1 [Oldenlandia corymbosa var. corymbosa]
MKPEAYAPQFVGLGPYHHFRPEVQNMTIFKNDLVRTSFYLFDKERFKPFSRCLKESSSDLANTFRSWYDEQLLLHLSPMMLSWIAVLDVVFLWSFIREYYRKQNSKDSSWHGLLAEFELDPEKLVPDLFMLENQIPTELIGRTLQSSVLTMSSENDDLRSDDVKAMAMFLFFCLENSPIVVLLRFPDKDHLEDIVGELMPPISKHILDIMCQIILKDHDITEKAEKPNRIDG